MMDLPGDSNRPLEAYWIRMKNVWLTVECLLLFLGIPLLFYYRVLPNAPIPALLVASVCIFLFLRRQPDFDREALWNIAAARANLRPVLLRTAVLTVSMAAIVFLVAPRLPFAFVRERPLLWVLVMILYPIVSVYPQELIYRAYFFHRYRPLFPTPAAMLAASALSFALIHLLFGRTLSVLLSALGGILFAGTYTRSRSLLLTAIEHALWGDFIFTIGLGVYFYHGARL